MSHLSRKFRSPSTEAQHARGGSWDPSGAPTDCSDAAVGAFLTYAVPRLKRLVPPWLEEHAWDAAAEAVLAVQTCRERFATWKDVLYYAKTILIHRAVAVRRHSAREVATDTMDGSAVHYPFERTDARSDLWRMLRRLPEPHRDLVFERHVVGTDVAELAATRGVATQTIYNLTSQGLAMLKSLAADSKGSL